MSVGSGFHFRLGQFKVLLGELFVPMSLVEDALRHNHSSYAQLLGYSIRCTEQHESERSPLLPIWERIDLFQFIDESRFTFRREPAPV